MPLLIFLLTFYSLTKTFKKNTDRLGLIALQDKTAKILNNPTHNFKVVLKNLKSLSVEGGFPLADGLKKSISMAKEENRRNPKSKSIAVILSDCFPEPITNKFDNIREEPAYKDIILQAKQFKAEKIPLVLIRPKYTTDYGNSINPLDNEESVYTTTGDKLAKDMIEISGGVDIPIKTVLGEKRKVKNMFGFRDQDYQEDLNNICDKIQVKLSL